MKWLEATDADLLAAHERAFDRDEAELYCPDPDDWDDIPLPDEPPEDWDYDPLDRQPSYMEERYERRVMEP